MHHTCNKHIYISHMRAQIVVLLIGPDEGSHRKASALLSTLFFANLYYRAHDEYFV